MKTKKLSDREIQATRISSLPTRPTAPSSLGGRGYTSKEMKEAFDRLPLLIIERFNLLLDDIKAVGDESILKEIPTSIKEGHSLYDLISDIKNGNLASYLNVGNTSLAERLAGIEKRLSEIETSLKIKEGGDTHYE